MYGFFSSPTSFSRPTTRSMQAIPRPLPTQQLFPSAFAATSFAQYTFRPRTRPFFLLLNLTTLSGNSAALSFVKDILNRIIPWRWRPSALFLRRFWRLYGQKVLRVFLTCCVLGLLVAAFKIFSRFLSRTKEEEEAGQDGLQPASHTSRRPAE